MKSLVIAAGNKTGISFRLLAGLLVAAIVLGLAVIVGRHASVWVLLLLLAGIGAALLLRELRWGLLALPAVALLVPFQIGTGTEVALTAAVLAVPPLIAVWLLQSLRAGAIRLRPSRLNLPLLALTLLILFSLFRGNLLWDPAIPKPANFLLVQIGQIAIYFLSFAALLLMGNVTGSVLWLRRITYGVLAIGTMGISIILFYDLVLGRGTPIQNAITHNMFMVWLVALPIALAAYDETLRPGAKKLLYALAAVALFLAVQVWYIEGDWVGGWAPPLVAVAVVLSIRYRKLRFLSAAIFASLLIVAVIGDPALLESGYWQQKWDISGGSRLALWQSIVELTHQSPFFGLGIAAYRYYHFVKPLVYQNAYWVNPTVSAHNMWVDLYAQLGIVGVFLYAWFLFAAGRLAWNLYQRSTGFARGYALAALGALAGIIFADILAETSLPFVYNMGFRGFQVSVVSWMLLGGLIVLENCQAEAVDKGIDSEQLETI